MFYKIKLCVVILIMSLFLFGHGFIALAFLGIGQDSSVPGSIGGSSEGKRLANPLGDEQGDVAKVANNLIKAALGLTGVLAIIAFIWGGIEWMTSGGNEPRIKKGKDMMIWAVVGLVAIFGSYAILNLIFQALGG